jgi:hypothetical protein
MKLQRHFILEARQPLTRAEFQRTHPRGSIAVDGYLPEGPWLDLDTLHANLNHHEAVDRLGTRCSTAQGAIGVRMGRFEEFFREGIHFWANDCDPDVATLLWVLENPARMRGVLNPLFNKMLHLLDMLDTTAATYPFPMDFDLGEYHWIFEPYFEAQQRGVIERKDPKDYERIVNECHLHLEQYLAGKPGRVEIVTDYDTIAIHPGWGMFRTHGSLSRMGLVAAGHFAFVLVRERPDGRWTYTLQRTSDGVRFPLQRLFAALNEREGGEERWGGGDTVGGSPRVGGSKLSPTEIGEIINEVLAQNVGLRTDSRRGGDRRTAG